MSVNTQSVQATTVIQHNIISHGELVYKGYRQAQPFTTLYGVSDRLYCTVSPQHRGVFTSQVIRWDLESRIASGKGVKSFGESIGNRENLMRWLSLDLLVDFGQVSPGVLLYGQDMMCINKFVYIMTIITRHIRLKLVTENGAWKSKYWCTLIQSMDQTQIITKCWKVIIGNQTQSLPLSLSIIFFRKVKNKAL